MQFLTFFINSLTGNLISEKVFVYNSLLKENLFDTFESKSLKEIPSEEKLPDVFNNNNYPYSFIEVEMVD